MYEIKKNALKAKTIIDFSQKYFSRLSEIFSLIDKKTGSIKNMNKNKHPEITVIDVFNFIVDKVS